MKKLGQSKRKFVTTLADRVETQVKEKKLKRLEFRGKIFSGTTNLTIILATLLLLGFIFYRTVAAPFLNANTVFTVSYYKTLALTNFFTSHLPFPPTGWVPSINSGNPVISSDFSLFYYLAYPLTILFNLKTSLELLSLIFFV